MQETTNDIGEPESIPYTEYEVVKLDKISLQDSEQDFTTTTLEEVRSAKPFNLIPANDNTVPVENFKARMEKFVGKDEYAAYVENGLDEFLKGKGRVNLEDLRDWIQENGPKVEVKKLSAGTGAKALEKEMAKYRHWLDTIDGGSHEAITKARNKIAQDDFKGAEAELANLSAANYTKAKKLLELEREWATHSDHESITDSATARFTMVNPKPLDQMPGAVDILVRKPQKPLSGRDVQRGANYELDTAGYKEKPKFVGGHFDASHGSNPNHSDKNIVGWIRGYMETLPNGEKVFHIFELQSDWAQQVRKDKELYKTDYERAAKRDPDIVTNDDPLLNYYESLALKAAIKHAKAQGATKIAISDAETAALSEGHDKAIKIAKDANGKSQYNRNISDFKSIVTKSANATEAGELIGGGTYHLEPTGFSGEYKIVIDKEPFIGGDRQHYDENAPNILKKLTGDSGKVVNFGEHQNATQEPHYPTQERFKTKEEAQAYISKEISPERQRYYTTSNFGDYWKVESRGKEPRQNLIFKNPDGSPKTSITARMFDISNVPTEKQPANIFKRRSYQPDNQEPTTTVAPFDESRRGFLRSLTPQFDQAAKVSTELSQGFKNWEARRDYYLGLAQETHHNLLEFPEKDVDAVAKLMDTAYRGRKELDKESLNKIPRGQEIYDTFDYYDKVGQIRQDLGIKIDGREASRDRNYIPHQLSDVTLDLFTNKVNTPAAKAAKREWAKYVETESGGKVKFDEALKDINDYVAALGGEKNSYKALNFGAIRKAAGYGIPESLRENSTLKSLLKYGKRAAADLAFYQEIESKPQLLALLKLPDPNTGKIPGNADDSISQSKEIRDSMKILTRNLGASSGINPKVNAFIRLVNSAILGPATGVRDVISIPANTLPYMSRLSDLKSAMDGILKFRRESANALRTAAKQPNIDKYQFNNILEAPDKVTEFANKGATLLRRFQGREALENFGRDITFSIGKELARNNIIAAQKGEKSAKLFLDKFSTLVDNPLELSEANLNQMAKNFVDRVQGTYGGRGLPAGVMEGSLAPFLSLQKWSIEKSNVIYQDVVKPFLDGSNRLPLLTYTLGSLLTGAAIQELNKALTGGKKGQEATLKETLAEPSIKNIAAEFATIAQLGSLAGVVSDGLKVAIDMGITGKTPRNIVSFPAATMLATMQENISNYSEALQQDGANWESTKMFLLDMIAQNVQALRVAANATIKSEEVEKSNKFRDLRVYKQLTGGEVGDMGKSNRYLDAEAKAFKKTKDLGEAAEMMPELLGKFQEKLATNPGDAAKFLRMLKANSYQTMPSMSNMPQEFAQYYEFLWETQGEDEALRRVEDYITQNALNKAKSDMVP